MLRKLAVSSLASLAAPLAAAVSAFFVTPVLLRALGGEAYGLWVLCGSVAAYASLLDLGMAGAATRFLAGALGEEDAERRAGLFLAFRRFYRAVGGGLIALGAVVVAASRLPTEGSAWATGLTVVGILVASSGIGFLFRVNAAILRANLEYQAIAFAGVIRTVAYTVVVLLAAERFDLVSLAMLFAALGLWEQALVWLQARRLAPLRRELERATPAAFRPLFGHAGKSMVGSLSAALRWKADTQIIGGFVSLGAVTQYSMGLKLPQLFFDLLYTLFGSQFVAAFAQWRRRNPDGDPREMVALAMKVCAIISLTGACTLFFVIPDFLERWIGPGYDEAKQLARILLPFWAFMVLPVPLSLFLISEGRHGSIALLSMIFALVNIALSLVLVVYLEAAGVVVATALDFMLLTIAYGIVVAPRIGLSPLGFLCRHIAFPCIRFTLTVVPLSYLLASKLLAPAYSNLILGGGVIFLGGASLGAIVISTRQDRRILMGYILSAFGKERTL